MEGQLKGTSEDPLRNKKHVVQYFVLFNSDSIWKYLISFLWKNG